MTSENSPGPWIKSPLSNDVGSCVEMRRDGTGGIQLRDSKNPDGPVLDFTQAEIAAFIGGADTFQQLLD